MAAWMSSKNGNVVYSHDKIHSSARAAIVQCFTWSISFLLMMATISGSQVEGRWSIASISVMPDDEISGRFHDVIEWIQISCAIVVYLEFGVQVLVPELTLSRT
jgi:hypothetical protein